MSNIFQVLFFIGQYPNSFGVLTTTDEEIMALITDQVASNRSKDPQIYAGAAEYLLYQGMIYPKR